MSKFERFLVWLMVVLVSTLLGMQLKIKFDPKKDISMEIYTLENIYYVDGLRVTNENNAESFIFGNTEQLSKYISRVTVEDNKEGLNCLNKYYGH